MTRVEPFELIALKREFFPNRDVNRFKVESLINACTMVKDSQIGPFLLAELAMASPENMRYLSSLEGSEKFMSQVDAAELACQVAGCVFVGNPPNDNVFDKDTVLWYRSCMRLGYQFCVKYGLEEFLFLKKRLIDSWNKQEN